MTFAVDKWKKNGWKIALVGVGVLLVIKFVLIPFALWVRDAASTTTGVATWWNGVELPLWAYTVGIPVLILIIAVLIAAMKDGKTGSEKLKKLADLFGAFAKLGLTLAVIAVLAIFIVGPRMFWSGNYTPPPTPVGGTQAAPAVPATPIPQSRTIIIPVGDLNAPLNQWSEEVRVVPGWNFRWDVVGQGGKIGVLMDGATRVVNEPTRRTDTHATQSLRFISLEGRPMQIAVSYYR